VLISGRCATTSQSLKVGGHCVRHLGELGVGLGAVMIRTNRARPECTGDLTRLLEEVAADLEQGLPPRSHHTR
jgi:hypothetical protein